MRSWTRFATMMTLLAALGATACQSQAPTAPGGGGGGGGNPTPAPTATPITQDPSTLTFDEGPAPFTDPTTAEERATTRYSSGSWVVTDGAFTQTATASSQTLMLQRYTGTALGLPNGLAPARYRADAEVQVYQNASTNPADLVGAPTGIWGFIPYFVDTQHYVLMMATGREAMVWVVDGLSPGDNWDAAIYRKWHIYLPQTLAAGDTLRWGAQVNAENNELEVFFNGEKRTTIRHPMIRSDASHSVAVVSNANLVRYPTLTLTPLSQQ